MDWRSWGDGRVRPGAPDRCWISARGVDWRISPPPRRCKPAWAVGERVDQFVELTWRALTSAVHAAFDPVDGHSGRRTTSTIRCPPLNTSRRSTPPEPQRVPVEDPSLATANVRTCRCPRGCRRRPCAATRKAAHRNVQPGSRGVAGSVVSPSRPHGASACLTRLPGRRLPRRRRARQAAPPGVPGWALEKDAALAIVHDQCGSNLFGSPGGAQRVC